MEIIPSKGTVDLDAIAPTVSNRHAASHRPGVSVRLPISDRKETRMNLAHVSKRGVEAHPSPPVRTNVSWTASSAKCMSRDGRGCCRNALRRTLDTPLADRWRPQIRPE